MEAEYYNSATLPFSNTIKASKAIVFSQYGTSKGLNEDRLGFPILRLNEFNASFILALQNIVAYWITKRIYHYNSKKMMF